MLTKLKSWAWWKIHKKPITKIIQSLMSQIEGLDEVSFKFNNETFTFTKPQNKES